MISQHDLLEFVVPYFFGLQGGLLWNENFLIRASGVKSPKQQINQNWIC